MSEQKWGVWCLNDRAFCMGSIGTEEYARRELPKWASGEKADVDPSIFKYELRRVNPVTLSAMPKDP